MQTFTVAWDAARLAWARERVRAHRMPRLPAEAGWRYGCDPDFLARLCAYWLDGFDEAKAAAELNRFPQILIRIEDLDLHAVHVVGEAEGRRPLLLIHGWPGSIYEFWSVIEPWPSRRATAGGRRTRSTS
ncbi:epoxide hydrolase N-terminal domain-containing protein [Methylobacterium oryzae CBMB20]